ncbi:hypothetical protein ACSBR2_003554 [Camellia fascicularis]
MKVCENSAFGERMNFLIYKLSSDHPQGCGMFSILSPKFRVSALMVEVQSRLGGIYLVSKLMNRKSVALLDEKTNNATNDFEKFDGVLQSLIGHKTSKNDNVIHVANLQNQLGKMELSIQDLEEELECLFRHLIKTRVSLFNILNH